MMKRSVVFVTVVFLLLLIGISTASLSTKAEKNIAIPTNSVANHTEAGSSNKIIIKTLQLLLQQHQLLLQQQQLLLQILNGTLSTNPPNLPPSQPSTNPPNLPPSQPSTNPPNLPPSQPSTVPSSAKNVTTCDTNLIKNIKNFGPPRFKLISPCVTVSGIVTLVHMPSDGDTVFALKLDPPYKSMVTAGNIKDPKMKGGLWVEEICQRPNTSPEPIHKGDCSFTNLIKKFSTPTVGQHLQITGYFVEDDGEAEVKQYGPHTEIHPVSSVKAA